jgi:hypothetical protein
MRLRYGLTLAWALAAAACDRVVDGDAASNEGLAVEDAPAAFHEDYCARLTKCCSPFEVPSVAECMLGIDQQIAAMQVIAENDGLVYDPTCWAETLEHLEAQACDPPSTSENDDECRPPCKAWHGEQQIGEYCTIYEVDVTDCANGLACTMPFCEQGDCKEVCLDPCARAALGERCLDVQCHDGLLCDVLEDECVPTPEIGEPCVWGSGCGEGAMCDDESDECVPADTPEEMGQPGAPCNSYRQCASGSCPAGFCAELPGRGEPCSEICAEGLECDPATSKCADPGPAICDAAPL